MPVEPGPARTVLIQYLVFFAIFLAIVGIILGSRSLLIAPPYAVTAYLVVFNRGSKYAQLRSVVGSYLAVIALSGVFELVLGVTVLALVLNVAAVSLFITFTPYSHPPALALTIFSYIAHDSVAFSLTSLVVLVIVAGADAAITRIPQVRRLLEGGAPVPP